MIDLEPIARVLAGDYADAPSATGGPMWEYYMTTAHAAYLAALKAIRVPSEGMVREGISWNTTPEKWTAMIDHLIQEAGDE